MNWNSLSDFAAMGGYGLYVWGAFGVTALVMAGEMLSLRARRRALHETAGEHAAGHAAPRPVDYREAAHEA